MDATPTEALKVLIVDDEPPARLRLRSLVQECATPRCTVLGEAASPSEAMQRLREQPCDVVLLDIVMPGGNGLRLADELRRLPHPPAVVFVTAHGEHALRAFEVEAADYLTKPVRRERLQAALLRVAQRRQSGVAAAPSAPVLVVSDRGRVLRVPSSEVLYLKAEQKYVTLCSKRGTWLLDDALADLEQRLGAGFLRVHRNAVVAVAAVQALEKRAAAPAPDDPASAGSATASNAADDGGWQLQLANGDWLAVSRRQLPAVREALAASAPRVAD